MRVPAGLPRSLDQEHRRTACEIVGATDSGTYLEGSLADWFAHAPRHVLAANLGVPLDALPSFGPRFERIARAG